MNSSIEELEKLGSLRKSGAVTEAEFEILKNSILNHTDYDLNESYIYPHHDYLANQSFFTKKNIGLIGAALLFVGVFCPLISLPILGSVNYFQNGNGDGVLILILAAVTAGATLADKLKWALYTGSVALIVMVISFVMFQSRMDEMQNEVENKLAGSPVRELSDAVVNSVQLEWGCAVLLLGAAVTIFAGWTARNSDI